MNKYKLSMLVIDLAALSSCASKQSSSVTMSKEILMDKIKGDFDKTIEIASRAQKYS